MLVAIILLVVVMFFIIEGNREREFKQAHAAAELNAKMLANQKELAQKLYDLQCAIDENQFDYDEDIEMENDRKHALDM